MTVLSRKFHPRARLWFCAATTFIAACARHNASGQVIDISVTVAPTCPYGIQACWAGAYEAISSLDGVESVDKSPDPRTSTAHIKLRGKDVPNLNAWRNQFKSKVADAYHLKGFEATIEGEVRAINGKLELQAAELHQPVTLKKIEHKVQWDFNLQRSFSVEPLEDSAYQQLSKWKDESNIVAKAGTVQKIRITGPIEMTDSGPSVEVRQYSILQSETESSDKKHSDR